eukprot:875838-Pyramimonas_sp.AAC.1
MCDRCGPLPSADHRRVCFYTGGLLLRPRFWVRASLARAGGGGRGARRKRRGEGLLSSVAGTRTVLPP